jgi:HTH-type transcriptional regulator / antitoxin HipB
MVAPGAGEPEIGGPGGSRLDALAKAVSRRRRELRLRQTELAALAGCSQRFVHTLEHAKPTLQLDKVLDVLEVLGLGLEVVPGQGEVADHQDSPRSEP